MERISLISIGASESQVDSVSLFSNAVMTSNTFFSGIKNCIVLYLQVEMQKLLLFSFDGIAAAV